VKEKAMAIIATDTGGGVDIKPIAQGTHLAICYMVVDLGKQRDEYQGQVRVQHQIHVRWELPNERVEWDDKDNIHREGPATIGAFYTLSLHEKSNLRGHLEAWRGRAFTAEELAGFDVSKLLGVPCMVTVTHKVSNGRIRDRVASVSGVPKGMEKPDKAENPLVLYDDEHRDSYDGLSDFLRGKIDNQVKDAPTPAPSAGGFRDDLDDDIPF
jgi:hypothetical protein